MKRVSCLVLFFLLCLGTITFADSVTLEGTIYSRTDTDIVNGEDLLKDAEAL